MTLVGDDDPKCQVALRAIVSGQSSEVFGVSGYETFSIRFLVGEQHLTSKRLSKDFSALIRYDDRLDAARDAQAGQTLKSDLGSLLDSFASDYRKDNQASGASGSAAAAPPTSTTTLTGSGALYFVYKKRLTLGISPMAYQSVSGGI